MQSGSSGLTAKPEESMLASATFDAVPRVGVVLSSLREAEEHDGTKLPGLANPCPADSSLTPAQMAAMLHKAVEFSSRRGPQPRRSGPPRRMQESDEWVVFLAALSPQAQADDTLVLTLMEDYATRGLGRRLTLAAEGPAPPSWQEGVRKLAAAHSGKRIEYIDLSKDAWLQAPAPRRTFAKGNPSGTYAIVKTIRECDRLLSVAPLATSPLTGISLAVANYWAIAPASVYGPKREKLLALGEPADVLTDLYLHHPAEFAVIGGSLHRDEKGAVRHNLVIAGGSAVAVDTIGAAVMGFQVDKLSLLDRLEARGFGVANPDSIWTRGNEIDEAKKAFQKPAGYL